MSGKFLGLALLAGLVAFAPQAEARRLFWWEAQPRQYDTVDPSDPYDGSYDPYVDPQDQSAQDMFNQDQYDQYQREMRRRHRYDPSGDRYDPALYDQSYDGGPDGPAQPRYNDIQPKIYNPAKPKKPKTVKADVAKPAPDTTTAAVTNSGTAPTATAVAKAPVKTPAVTETKTTEAKTTDAKTTATKAPETKTAEAKSTGDTPKPAKGGSVTCAKGEEIVASYGFLDISQKTCEGSSLVYSAVRGKSNFEVEVNPSNGEVTAVRKLS